MTRRTQATPEAWRKPFGGMRPPLAALGLVAVAVVSGFMWWLIRHEPADEAPAAAQRQPPATTASESEPTTRPTTEPGPATVTTDRFTFTSVTRTHVTARCDDVSYGKVRTWFRSHPCERVARGLYEIREDDDRALVSVIVVTMPSAGDAQRLKDLTDTSGTGNVSDMVRDGTVELPGAPSVAGGNYASTVAGRDVTVVETEFFGDTGNHALLDEIAADALKVGVEQR